MHSIERPSCAAIAVLPHAQPLIDWLDEALRAERYRRYDKAVPGWHTPAEDEWLAFMVTRSDDLKLSILVPEHQGMAYRVAFWLARTRPPEAVVGYRYERGLDPSLKYYVGGKPRYKEGEDEDYEVDWNVPRHIGVDIVTAQEAGLPGTCAEFEEVVGTALAPYNEQTEHHGPEDVVVSYLLRDSPLW